VNVPWRKFARTYTACGVLIVLLMAVLPMMTFFQTAVGNEVEALVKAGQMDIVNRLLRRMEALNEKSWKHDANMALWYHMPFFFESTWCVQTDLFSALPDTFGHLRQPCDRTSTARGGNEINSTEPFTLATNEVGERIETLLPQYSDHTIPMRDLHHGSAGDQSWYVLRAGRILALFHRLDLNNNTRAALVSDIEAAGEGLAAEHVALMLQRRGLVAQTASAMGTDAAAGARKVPRKNGLADPAEVAKLKPLEREARRYLDYVEHQARRLTAGGQWLVVVSRM